MGGLGDLFDKVGDFYSDTFKDFTGETAAKNAKTGYGRAFESTKNKEKFLEELFGKLEGSIEDSYGKAFGEIGQLGASGRSDILAREAGSLGSANQSLTSRGLGNTTVLEGMNRGIMSDTNRDLSDLSESMAGLRSNLQLGRGQALGQAYMGRYSALSDLYDTRASLHLGKGQLPTGSFGEWLGPGGGAGDIASLFATGGMF